MDNPKQLDDSARMTLDELFRKTFSNFLANLLDALNIFEEQTATEDSSNDSGS